MILTQNLNIPDWLQSRIWDALGLKSPRNQWTTLPRRSRTLYLADFCWRFWHCSQFHRYFLSCLVKGRNILNLLCCCEGLIIYYLEILRGFQTWILKSMGIFSNEILRDFFKSNPSRKMQGVIEKTSRKIVADEQALTDGHRQNDDGKGLDLWKSRFYAGVWH